MTKLAPFVLCGTLVCAALVARAADKPADKAPAAAAPAAKPPAPAAAPAGAKIGAPAAAAPAAAPAPAAPPKPSAEIDTLYKGYEGSWKCETTFAANAMGPGSPETKVKTDVKIKKEPSGFWYKGDFKIGKSKTMPGMSGSFLLGYDEATKAPVNVTFDSMGGYAVEHAPGATPAKLVFVGDSSMMGMKVKLRETMTAKDAKNIEHAFDVDMGKGFQPMGNDVCKK